MRDEQTVALNRRARHDFTIDETFEAQDLEACLRMITGLWVEAIADRQHLAPGDRLTVNVSALARGGVPLKLEALTLESDRPEGIRILEQRKFGQLLSNNMARKEAFSFTLPADTPLGQPHWLGGAGAEAWAGLPESPAPLRLRAQFGLSEGSFQAGSGVG